MSKRLSASFKSVAVFAGVSLSLVLFSSMDPAVAAPEKKANGAKEVDPLADLPVRELHLSDRGGQPLRVGDTLSYELRGGDANAEARWQVDPAEGGLKKGILFRPGRLLTPLVAGDFQAPALAVVDETGKAVAKTDPIQFSVQSNLPAPPNGGAAEPPKAEPPIGPLELPVPMWVQSAIGTAVLLVFLVLAYFIVRAIKRRAARALKAILPQKPYDVVSLERLDTLAKRKLIEQKTFKPLYFGVSETLKFYLGERFDFDARESTTSELFALLRERVGKPGLTEALVLRVEKLFERLDPVKFADVVPTEGEARSVLQEAKEIVLVSRKVVTEPITPGGVKR